MGIVNFTTRSKKHKFEKLIEEHLDNLMQLAYMRCGNKELAEDLVQEASIKAYKSFMEKDEIENPKAWLFKILINTHIDYSRKKQLEKVNADDVDFVSPENVTKDIENRMFYKDLNDALNELEEEQRVVVYLADVIEYSYKEVASTLNIPIGTVMSRLHRARQNLRKLLVDKGYSRGYAESTEKS